MANDADLSRATPPVLKPVNPFFIAAMWLALALIFLILALQINRRISNGHSGDFRHFYFAAGALLDHRDLYGPVPLDVVERAIGRPAGPVEKAWYTTDSERYLYPPMIAMLYTPIARLRFETAQRVALVINSLMVIAGIVLVSRLFTDRLRLRPRELVIAGAALLGTLINLDKVHVELQMFQTNALMFFMFALSLWWLDRRPIAAGIPLGFIFNIKYLSIGLLPWLLIRRRWTSAASCAVSTIVFALLPALISGWNANLRNLSVAYGGLLHMVGVHGSAEQANVDDIRDFLSCSITSAMARTTHRGESLVVPMLLAAAVAGLAVVIVIWLYRRRGIPVFAWPSRASNWPAMISIEFVAIIAATLCFSPQTNTRHLMLALLITVPLSALIVGAPRGVSRVPAIVGALLIGVGFIFPPGGQAPESHQLALWWFGIGGQCWCLLIAMLLLVWSASIMGVSPMEEMRGFQAVPK
jgi:hypothetical protein